MNMNDLPFVSIIIPCRNEENFISECLDSILANDYPQEKMEILVIDGMSNDRTRQIVLDYNKRYPFIFLLDNPKIFVPTALNIGIKKAKGDIIIRMDAHALYKKDYIFKCVEYLEKYKADNVGGVWKIIPRENTLIGRAIAKVLSSYFGTGNAYYKIGVNHLMEVDTVPFGCYRKEIFNEIGFFNENLHRSQDIEFNLRMKRAGKKIYLFPEIVGYYYARSKLKDFLAHAILNGIWSIYPLKFTKTPLKFRHYIPFIFVLSLLGSSILAIFSPAFFYLFLVIVILYFLVNLYFSIKISISAKEWRYLFVLPFIFVCYHLSYGLGSMWGVIKILGDYLKFKK